MATPIKKTAAPPAPAGINFGDLDMYVTGGGIPAGVNAGLFLVTPLAPNGPGLRPQPRIQFVNRGFGK